MGRAKINRICLYCGKSFTPPTSNWYAKCCSPAHSWLYWKENVKRDTIIKFMGRLNPSSLTENADSGAGYIKRIFGISIPQNYEVHHKDCDRSNNTLNNLLLISHKDHVILHHKLLEYLKEKNLIDEYLIWCKDKYKITVQKLRDYIFTNGNTGLKVYLAGPMESISSKESERWRDKVTKELINYFGDNITIYDPTKHEIEKLKDIIPVNDVNEVKKLSAELKENGQWEKFDAIMSKIIYTDIDAVMKSTFMIVLLDFEAKMGGTISEITTAWDLKIPMYTVCYDKMMNTNSWVIGMCRNGGKIFPSIPKLLENLFNDYKEFKNVGTQDSNSKS